MSIYILLYKTNNRKKYFAFDRNSAPITENKMNYMGPGVVVGRRPYGLRTAFGDASYWQLNLLLCWLRPRTTPCRTTRSSRRSNTSAGLKERHGIHSETTIVIPIYNTSRTPVAVAATVIRPSLSSTARRNVYCSKSVFRAGASRVFVRIKVPVGGRRTVFIFRTDRT